MLYDRKIKYLDYYEGGTKVNGGGFAKLEVRENTLRIELTIRGLHPTDSFERDIVLQGAEKEEILGQVRIQNGFGQFRYSCGVDQGIGSTGISYSDLRGIRISIGGTREILCQWDNVPGESRIAFRQENTLKTKSVLQESKRESMDESHTDNKTDSEVPAYIENEQKYELKPGRTEKEDEKIKEATKEEYKIVADRDEKEKKQEDIDWVKQGAENGEGENREGKNKEGKNGEGENREGKNKEGENGEGENRKDKNRNEQDRGDIGNTGNTGNKEDIKKDIEKKESIERNSKGSEIREEDAENNDQSKPIEIQAQGAIILSDAISPQFPEESLQTDISSGMRSEDRTKDEPDKPGDVGNVHEEQPDVRKAPVKLMEDKWQQLSAIYPHIQPFHDERDYLSLTPSDFVLFPDRFYRAVNNSFLLHGYYNYHHLILARIERRGEIIYYIGVPGNYFEREKQVAIMFGFESFECETEPAKTGDFGYYMMRTEL